VTTGSGDLATKATNQQYIRIICIASTHYGYLSPVWLEIWNVLLLKFFH